MFGWLKDRRIQKYLEQTRLYIQEQYVEPKKEAQKPSTGTSSGSSKVQYSRRDTPSEPRPQFQVWDNDNKPKFSEREKYDNGPKFSLRDNYDSSSVQRTMRSLSSATPTSRVLRDLENSTNMTFVDKLLEHISKRHMRDSDVYRAAQVDRRLFSKIVSDREYKPAKDTCVAFAFALRLTLSEAEDLLSRAGYTLSHSSKRDIVLEYFFKEHIYDLTDINEVLYRLNQKVLGRV